MSKSWLELVVSANEDRKGLMKSHSCVAADGYRMHIENSNGACRCGDNKTHEGFDRLIEMVKDTPFCFAINQEYLMDALSGINSYRHQVLFFIKPGGTSPIVIQDDEGSRTAIIMPMAGTRITYPKLRQQHATPKKIQNPKKKSAKAVVKL